MEPAVALTLQELDLVHRAFNWSCGLRQFQAVDDRGVIHLNVMSQTRERAESTPLQRLPAIG